MAKFTENSTLGEVMNDPDGKNLINRALPFAAMHPRFSEGLTYTLREIIDDNMASMVGISNEKIKEIVEQICNL